MEKLPLKLLQTIASTPLASQKFKDSTRALTGIFNKLDNMYPIFDFFIRGDWRYESKNIY
jgi:hypothetical protein